MKLGNTSQSKVPVPNFFLNKNLKQLETFEISEGKRYFREKDLFGQTKDLNFCNNPRNFHRKFEKINREKYLPDLSNINSILKIQTKSQIKRLFNAKNTSPKDNTYNNFRDYVEKTNISNFTNPDLRNEIRGNLNVLINKINDVYDLEKWGQTDTRTNFLQTNSEQHFNNFNNFNSNSLTANNFNYNNNGSSNLNNFHSSYNTANDFYFKTRGEIKKFNETDADKFKTILRQKVNNMSIDKRTKSRLMKNFDKFNDSSSDKFYKPKATSIIAKEAMTAENLNLESINNNNNNGENNTSNLNKSLKNENENLNLNLNINSTAEYKKTNKNLNLTTNSNHNNNFINSNTTNNYNKTINNNNKMHKSNYSGGELIDINDNFNIGKITLPVVANKYSKVSSDFLVNLTEVEKLRKDNTKIYERFKDSSLFKDFPSPDRKEFVVKKGEKLKTKSQNDKKDKTLLDFSAYNASKHKHVFCEDYDTNESVMVKYKKSKEVF